METKRKTAAKQGVDILPHPDIPIPLLDIKTIINNKLKAIWQEK